MHSGRMTGKSEVMQTAGAAVFEGKLHARGFEDGSRGTCEGRSFPSNKIHTVPARFAREFREMGASARRISAKFEFCHREARVAFDTEIAEAMRACERALELALWCRDIGC